MDKYAAGGKDPLKASDDWLEKQKPPGQRKDPQNRKERHKAEMEAEKDTDKKAPEPKGIGHVDPAEAHSGPPQTNPRTAEDDMDSVKTKTVEIPPKTQIDNVVEGQLGGGEKKVSSGPIDPQDPTPKSS